MAYSQKAVDKWKKGNTKSFSLMFMFKSDADIIAKLESVPNKTDYVRQLIRADINPGKPISLDGEQPEILK